MRNDEFQHAVVGDQAPCLHGVEKLHHSAGRDREYGGTSVVLDLMGNWLLLVTGGEPTPDKPTVTLASPDDPDRVSAEIIFRVGDCQLAFEFLSKRGAEFLTTPLDRGGEIRAFFRDLDGHLFEISELT